MQNLWKQNLGMLVKRRMNVPLPQTTPNVTEIFAYVNWATQISMAPVDQVSFT
jgi:hypothetical protein